MGSNTSTNHSHYDDVGVVVVVIVVVVAVVGTCAVGEAIGAVAGVVAGVAGLETATTSGVLHCCLARFTSRE